MVSLFPPGDRAGQFGHRVTPVWTTKADTAEVGARAYGAEFDLRRATAKMSAPPGSTHRRRGAPAISLFDDQGGAGEGQARLLRMAAWGDGAAGPRTSWIRRPPDVARVKFSVKTGGYDDAKLDEASPGIVGGRTGLADGHAVSVREGFRVDRPAVLMFFGVVVVGGARVQNDAVHRGAECRNRPPAPCRWRSFSQRRAWRCCAP